jgi:hypothetical protein
LNRSGIDNRQLALNIGHGLSGLFMYVMTERGGVATGSQDSAQSTLAKMRPGRYRSLF